jgi:hypothetical protein
MSAPAPLKWVFIVQHEHPLASGCDDAKLIGVYESQSDAEAAAARVKTQPGFCDWPDGFTIDRYEIGRDHWTEGFVTLP